MEERASANDPTVSVASATSVQHESDTSDRGDTKHVSVIAQTVPAMTLNTTSQNAEKSSAKKGLKFWMCVVALMIASFLVMLENGGVGTAMPVIVADLHGEQFEWVGSAYALAGAAFLPLSGGLVQVFGRRSIMLIQIALFAAGSALCGAAPSLNVLIAGRTIQGIGASGVASSSQIILSDLVPLKERGTYNGFISLAYGLGTSTAPLIGGALASAGQWRWFFYLNLPLCGFTGLIVLVFLDLKVPRGSFREKLMSLDWVGNTLVVFATTAIILALTWGGVTFPWISAAVLVPLFVGVLLMIIFVIYEAKVPDAPLMPLKLMSTRTGISGYLQAFLGNLYLYGVTYYLPVYFQACKDASATRSGIDILGLMATVMPFGIVAGLSVAKSGVYRPQIWLSWAAMMLAVGLFSTLHASSPTGNFIGFEIIAGLGIGILLTTGFFPVLAPLHVSLNANALAFYMFVRWFSQIWGVTIGGAVLQNELNKRLPTGFIKQFPSGTSIAYSIIPTIPSLSEPTKTEVRVAFADSLRVYWLVLLGLSGLGMLISLLMKAYPLNKATDDKWGLNEKNRIDTEKS